MKNSIFRYCNSVIFQLSKASFFFIIYSFSFLESQDLKKDITIPFPNSITEDSSKPQKSETIHPIEKKPENKHIIIPFPNDKVEERIPEIEFRKKETELPATDKKADSSANIELPLEKLIIYPKLEVLDPVIKNKDKSLEPKETATTNRTNEIKNKKPLDTKEDEISALEKPKKELQPEISHEVGKALVTNGNKSDSQETINKPVDSKSTENSLLPKSKVTGLKEYSQQATSAKSRKAAEVEIKKTDLSTAKEKTKELAANNIPETKLPNSEKPSKKNAKDKKKIDESTPPFERSKFHLNRDDKPSATPELNTASSTDGEKANLAKMDQIRLLAIERKKNEAKNIVDGISEPEFRFKGLYELAVGLENSAKGNRKLKEEAIPFHLSIITEAPKSDAIIPKSLWALSHLLFTIGDHTPSLDHLSEIIINHANSEFADDAIYLSGRIYEESTTIRNLNRAKKYYELFLKNESKKHFKKSIYLPFVKKRLEMLEN